MILLIVIMSLSILFAAYSIAEAIGDSRERTDTVPRFVYRINRSGRAVTSIGFSGMLGTVFLSDPWFGIVSIIVIFVGVLLIGGSLRVANGFRAEDEQQFWRFVRRRASARKMRLLRSGCLTWQAIAPPGSWNEIKPAPGVLESIEDRVTSPRTIMKVFFVCLGAVYVASLFALAIMIQQDVGPSAVFLSTVLSYNLLFITPILTLASILTVLIGIGLRALFEISTQIAFRKALNSILQLTAIGTAGGVLVATLSPLVFALLGSSAGIADPSTSVLSPKILLELPALGVLLGYIGGIFWVPFTLGDNLRNLLYRATIFPGIFWIIFSGMLYLDVTSRSLEARIFSPAVPLWDIISDACVEVGWHSDISEMSCSPVEIAAAVGNLNSGLAVNARVLWVVFTILVTLSMLIFLWFNALKVKSRYFNADNIAR